MVRTVTGVLLAAAIGVAGCGDAEVDEVPETAEIESETFGTGLELDEEIVLGVDDVGETIMATGWVSGVPLENGFFLRTENNRVIFVETDTSVSAGDTVRVIGPLVAAEAAVFEGWEADAIGTGVEAEWDVETVVFIDTTSVTPL